jgi:hypothetical protein
MQSDTSVPQTPPSFSQGLGPVPASTWAHGSESHLALDRAFDQVFRNQRRADASRASSRDVVPGSVREFPEFEQGAGI